MKIIQSVNFRNGTKEELLPDFSPDFPYIASRVQLDSFIGHSAPWHWHKEMELFYIEKGSLEYHTPKGKYILSAGSAGLVNSNILHMTKTIGGKCDAVLHIFDSSLVGGNHGSLIEQKFIAPLTSSSQLDVITLSPESRNHAALLELIQASFQISESDPSYEIKLRNTLSEIWLQFFTIAKPMIDTKNNSDKMNDKIKMMIIYIQEHYADKITISQIAAAAFCSERECFRVFRTCLHMTPAEYLRTFRLQKACLLLTDSKEPITAISHICGLGSSSYFGKTFREYTGCTPSEYRHKALNQSDLAK